MRHTCCKFVNCNAYDITDSGIIMPYLSLKIQMLEPSEIKKLHEEDDFIRGQLDALMELYGDLHLRSPEHYDKFWGAWWGAIEEFVPIEVWISVVGTADVR